jgi:hypothetical protein
VKILAAEAELLQADGRTERLDEKNSHTALFCEVAYNERCPYTWYEGIRWVEVGLQLFLTTSLDGTEKWVSIPIRFNPWKRALIFIELEAGWAPDPDCWVWRRKYPLRVRSAVALQGIYAHSSYSVDLFWNNYIRFHSILVILIWENGITFWCKITRLFLVVSCITYTLSTWFAPLQWITEFSQSFQENAGIFPVLRQTSFLQILPIY